VPLWGYCQQNFNFTKLSTKNGLSCNTVNAILKDRYGLMWFATADGLNRFDGSTFTVYRHRDNDSTSLLSSDILSLCEDRSGTLWIGTGGGPLVFYDRVHDQFHRYRGDAFWRNAQNETIRTICEDHFGRLWVSSYSGLRIVDLKNKKTSTFTLNSLKAGNDAGSVTALSLFEDHKHRMWIGTNAGLLLFNWQNGKITHYLHNEKDGYSLSNNAIKSIGEDSLGNIWFGTANGLNLLLSNGRFRKFLQHKESNTDQNETVYSITAAHQDLWLGTESGLKILNILNFKIKTFAPSPRNIFSLSDKSVRTVFIDEKGICWLGTYQGGVNKLDPNLALFNLKLCDPFDPLGLKAPAVTAFAELDKDKIFIGTDNGGLQVFNIRTGLLNAIKIGTDASVAGSHLSVLALKYDHNGELWIGTYQKGLYRYDPKTGECQHFEAGSGRQHISQNDIFCIEEDKQGRIWIGTNGEGVDIYDPRTKAFTNWRNIFHNNSRKLRFNKFIRAICQGNGDEMWVGSFGGGVGVFNCHSNTFFNYTKANSALTNDGVISLLHDKSGRIWAGTNGGGLNLFNFKTHTFTAFLEKDGISNSVIQRILEDRKGQLWVSTNKGINSFDPNSRKFNIYTCKNGVQDSPFIRGSGISTSAGLLFFGGQEGFNYFDPLHLPEYDEIPHVMFIGLRVANNAVSAGEQSPLHEQIAVAKEIKLTYGRNFSISYIAVNYTNPHQDQYSYKLNGFDKDWNYVGKLTTAYYTNLDPGTYSFQVRACNNRGIWNPLPTTITIKVLPPWWRTIYAYLIYVLCAVGILFYSRHKGIEKIKRKLASEEEKREAQRMHDLDLLKINFLTNLSHEFRTPVSLIMAPVDKLMSLNAEPVIAKEILMIRRNARRLLNLVNQLLDFRKMEEQELKLNLSDEDLVEFVRDAVNSFQDISERRGVELEFVTGIKILPARFDKDKIERILFNLLSNAFKFTQAGGKVSVNFAVSSAVNEERQFVKLVITDSGIGIPVDKQTQIFQRFYQIDTAGAILNQGSGIGLAITKEFVELHGGTIELASQPKQGSIFTIRIPVIPPVKEIPKVTDQEQLITEEVAIENTEQTEAIAQLGEKAVILLVEDNDDYRYYLRENLKATYKVIEALNGKEGWQKALSCHPDLIITDISMPLMNGIKLCEKIKTDERTSFIPVIMLTALVGEQEHLSGLKTGANDYLTKPFSFRILRAKVQNAIKLNQNLKSKFSKQIHLIAPEIKVESADEKLLSNVAQFIEEKSNNAEFSIEELSKYLGMSRSSLYKKIFELTGLPPIEYVRSVRLQKASVLLETNQYTIREIAFMTGFDTPAYFSKLFKAKYSLTPSEYLNVKRKESG
jgi:signal transduction histidine kinase/ligand-binding sensor domain-containing protein/DNA-binding response OmpR family regulator